MRDAARSIKRLAAVVFAISFALPSCLALEEELPTSARVAVVGDGPGPFVLVTSNQFLLTGAGRRVELAVADTLLVEIGFDESFELGPGQRLYARLSRPEGNDATPSVTLQMQLEGGETICARAVPALADNPLECIYLGGLVEGGVNTS